MKYETKEQRRRLSASRVAAFAAFALAALCLPGAASAQWTAPNTQGNINTTNTGNTGVGTTTPRYKFEIATPATNTQLRFGSDATDSGGYLISTNPSQAIMAGGGSWNGASWLARSTAASILSADSGAFMFFTNGGLTSGTSFAPAERMRISPAGNVGVGTTAPTFLLDVMGSTNTPFRVRDAAGREYFSTGTRTGPVPTWVAPVASIAGGRLIVDSTTPDGNNDTLIRRFVNSMIFNPSDHPTLPGALIVRQVGGYAGLFVDQQTNGNVGIGTTAPMSKLHVAGNITVDGNINAKYQDVAEWVPSTQKLNAGTVVILDVERDNHVAASLTSYDTRVAGVISAQPGISLGEKGEGKVLVATTGRVKVRVDATRGAIKVGDLLVTSEVAGVAMKSQPLDLGGVPIHRPGTLIGKALESLEKGTGEILVLLSLQ
jgi:hypothetical protein